jgi:gluconate 5-dehydrogenase
MAGLGSPATPLCPARSTPNRNIGITAERLDRVRARTPLGRRGHPPEIAGPAVFLASEAASYVNAHVLTVDGGYSIAL